MPSISIQFHQNVEYFLALVYQIQCENPQYLRSHDSQTTLRSNIRQCLRNIQEQLNHASFDLQAIYESFSDPGGTMPVLTGEKAIRNFPVGSKDMEGTVAYDQVIGDLLSLLMTDYDAVATLSHAQSSHETTIKHRVAFLLAMAPALSPTALCTVLNRILRLMDQETKMGGTVEEGTLQFLGIFTSHITGYPQLHPLQLTDNDVFVGLHVALSYHERLCNVTSSDESSVVPPPQALALFVQTLIGYVAFVCLGGGNQEPHINLDHWLQMRFIEQHGYSSTPDHLRRATETYINKIELFGMNIIEFTLQLMEETIGSSREDQDKAQRHSEENRPGQPSPPRINDQLGQCDADYLTILQYATLATTFLVAMKHMHFSPMPGVTAWAFEATGRTLWREFSNALVQCFTYGEATPDLDDDATFITRQTTSAPVRLNRSAAATDTLWTLAKLYYVGETSNSIPGQRNDIPMLVTTILSLWKNAEYLWDEFVVAWIRHLLQFSFPSKTQRGKELRQPLQALILSSLYFPNPDVGNALTSRKKAINSLKKLVLTLDDGTELESSVDGADPWKIWITKQLPIDQGRTLQNI